MKLISMAAVAMALMGLAGCQTTQEVAKAQSGKWIGQPADAFFRANGPPQSSFPLQDGGVIHTWRGGETVVTEAAKTQTLAAPALAPARPAFASPTYVPIGTPSPVAAPLASPRPAGLSQSSSTTTTTVSTPAPGTTVTTTKTTSSSFGFTPPPAVQPVSPTVVITPERRIPVFCEAQINANAAGIITGFNITRDTRAAGFALSRCAEVFGE